MPAQAVLRFGSAVVLAAALVACGNHNAGPSILGDETFVAVPRSLSTAEKRGLRTGALRAAPSAALTAGESFYLAIKRSELSKRFFLSAFVKQFFPDGVRSGAAAQVGTRVVSFKIQNDQLFMFDVADIHKSSEAFDPQLVLEAWPIVRGDAQFERDSQSQNFVLIDPSAGLNRFSLIAEFYFGPPKFQIGVSYLQNFKRLSDGVTFEQVFTGEATEMIHGFGGGEFNLLRASGTLGITLRSYAEGPGFTQTQQPPGAPTFYFLSEPRIVPNAGFADRTPVKWNIKPGMSPIRWTISPDVLRLADDPFYGRYDVLGAIKKGIENWNEVFGFKALEAVVGDVDATPADDVTNFLYVDVNPEVGFSFADWRTNPNTGEIRGASVYFNTIFIDFAAFEFDFGRAGAPLPVEALSGAAAKPKRSLTWAGIHDEKLCVLPASPLLGEDLTDVSLETRTGATATAALTGKELVERIITHVILHEIGHTLGLRHNFKGSLLPPSSSTMDYLLDEDGVFVTSPGSWDTDAVKFLYGLSNALPAQPFCNDEGTRFDPDCTRFDSGSNPLANYWTPLYRSIIGRFLTGASPFTPSGFTLSGLLAYVRVGRNSAIKQQAFDEAFGPVTALAAPAAGKIGPRVDLWSGVLQRQLFPDPPSGRAFFVNNPNLGDLALRAKVLAQEGGYLRNTNTVTGFANRRTSVDVLKTVQLLDAFNELVQARAAIAASANPNDLENRDLLSRIDAAINPYFR
jgi:hypothetical protein